LLGAYLPVLSGEKLEPMIVTYTKKHAPDTNAARFWLMNCQRPCWKERQKAKVEDNLASQTSGKRLASVLGQRFACSCDTRTMMT
jgi:hypothetical protein